MKQDLGAILKANPEQIQIFRIVRVFVDYLSIRLLVVTGSRVGNNPQSYQASEIVCSNAVDYSIRPKNSATLEGGPGIEFYEQHALLQDKRLQLVPGGDGKVFDPPLTLKLLLLDESHVIAERFEIGEYVEDLVKRTA